MAKVLGGHIWRHWLALKYKVAPLGEKSQVRQLVEVLLQVLQFWLHSKQVNKGGVLAYWPLGQATTQDVVP